MMALNHRSTHAEFFCLKKKKFFKAIYCILQIKNCLKRIQATYLRMLLFVLLNHLESCLVASYQLKMVAKDAVKWNKKYFYCKFVSRLSNLSLIKVNLRGKLTVIGQVIHKRNISGFIVVSVLSLIESL